MKRSQLALAVGLFTLPIAGAVLLALPSFAAATVSEFGDLSAMHAIIVDTQALVAAGNDAGAKSRITDFETAWDQAAGDLRSKNAAKWDAIDMAADAALDAVRSSAPNANASLSNLLSQIDNPGAANTAGIATTDVAGKPLPCEDMLAQYRTVQPNAAALDDATKAKVADLESKGLERCNADDDKRADDFFAQAIQLIGAK